MFGVRITLPFHCIASETMALIIFHESWQCHSADSILSCNVTLVISSMTVHCKGWRDSSNIVTHPTITILPSTF